MLFLTKYESNLIVHGFCSPSHYNGVTKFCGNKIFCYICCRINLYGWSQKYMGSNIYYYIATLSYFISLKTANTQKSRVFLLRISTINVNASVVTCRYPQIYNFSFRKEFLETLCKCIYLEF